MTDSRFPGRPDHPDFWLIAGTTTSNDELVDRERKPAPHIIQEHYSVDAASVLYVAEHRARRVVDGTPTQRKIAAGAALWLDGFLAGLAFAKKRAEVNDLEGGLGDS